MNSRNYLTIILTTTSVIFLVLIIVLYITKPKVGYVNVSKVYDQFSLKKEYATQLEKIQNQRKSRLDSLELGLRAAYNKAQLDIDNADAIFRYKAARTQLVEEQSQVEQQNASTANYYDELIWKQLNQYTREFGEKKRFDLLHGANGSGSLMYANSTLDVTDELITYVNQRYVGESN